jgi:hypothetical protein
MQFNKLINSILKESAENVKYCIYYKGEMINVGDVVPIEAMIGDMAGGLTMGGKDITWAVDNIRLTACQPKIGPADPERIPNRSVYCTNSFGKRYSIMDSHAMINGTIDIDNIDTVASYNVTFKDTSSLLTVTWVVHQANNKDGYYTTWYNGRGGFNTKVLDFHIVDEKDFTKQAHKDSDLIDMIDF